MRRVMHAGPLVLLFASTIALANCGGSGTISAKPPLSGDNGAVGSPLTDTGRVRKYEIVDLGAGLQPKAINSSNVVVGGSSRGAFKYANGVTTYLGILAGDSFSYAADVNNRGLIVGTSGTRSGMSHAVMYTSSGVVNLGAPDTSDTATSINNAGEIVGQNIGLPDSPATDACSGAALEFDALGHVQEIQGLGADLPSAINDKGQIVGDHCTDWPDRTVAFSYPPLSILSGPGSDPNDCGHHYLGATDINQRGDIVGIYQNNDCVRHGFLLIGSVYIDIPPVSNEAQSSETFATAVNDRDWVVGAAGGRAIVDVGGTTYDLNTLVTGAGCAQWVLGEASDINDSNVIVGVGLLNGAPHGYMLRPQ